MAVPASDRRPALPPPLWGRAGWGVGRGSRGHQRAYKSNRLRLFVTSRPPPLSPPHKGEGKSKPPACSSRRTIRLIAALISPLHIGRGNRHKENQLKAL